MLEKELSFADLPVPLSEIYEAMGYADAVPDEAVEKEVRGVLERVLPEPVLKGSSIRCSKKGIW